MPRRTSLTPLSDAISLCALTQEEAAALLSVGLPALRKMAQGAVNVPAWVMDKLATEFLRVEAGTEDEGLTDHQALRRRVIRDLRRRARRGKAASEVVRTPDGNVMTLEVRDAVVSEVEGGGHRIDCQVLLTCAGKSRQTRFQTGWDAEGERVVRDASAEIKLYGRKTNSVTIARSSWVSALRHVVPAWRGGEKSEANIGPDLDDLDDFLPEVLGRVGALLETVEHHLNPSLETIRKAVSAS